MEIKDITIDDFPEELKDIVDIVGITQTVKICEIYSGISVYFPKHESITRESRIRQLYKNLRKADQPQFIKSLHKSMVILKAIRGRLSGNLFENAIETIVDVVKQDLDFLSIRRGHAFLVYPFFY